ncbi:phosphomannomutase/phosphoglucomutase [candidate division TA06 bacterium]|nr:phosphomannomutase/phosphoglucomutase [candidate division TA06 bacterium]
MMLNPNIFRLNDIRGVAERDLTDEVVEKIGKGFGTYIRKAGLRELVVGRDIRLSSPRIHKALIQGILSTGCNVTDIGLVPTPVFYFSLFYLNRDGGMMITGSHNPIEYNGLKVCKGKEAIYGEEIQRIREIIESAEFGMRSAEFSEGRLDHRDPNLAYILNIEEGVKVIKTLKVVIDPGNGTAGPVAERLLRKLGCQVIPINSEPDGRFPKHLPDPTIPEYMQELIEKVKEEEADLGIGYDGDGDRIGVVDETGEIIWGDKLLGIFAKGVLEERRGAPIVFEVKCSQGLVEFIESRGGKPLMWKTGHSLIKSKMKEVDSPLAGEMSGHIFFRDRYYGFDDALYASARLLEILSKTDKPLSRLAGEIPHYPSTPEIRVECPDQEKFRVVEAIKNYFKKSYQVIDIDGVRILFSEGWGLVRASNTQPILVLRFEAKTEKGLEEIQRVVLEKLREYPEVKI